MDTAGEIIAATGAGLDHPPSPPREVGIEFGITF
jgi:hypothetical protein